MKRLDGKVALITGGSRGIGRAIALALAREGAAVAINYRASAQEAAHVVAELEMLDTLAIALQADVTQGNQCARMVDEVVSRFGRLDVLVNNAGRIVPMETHSLDEHALGETIDVNLKATYMMSRLAVRTLRENRGCMVNIASAGSYPFASHFAAAKAGVVALTQSLAVELAPLVRVNAVSPGYTNTGDPTGWSEERQSALAERIPMRRFARPDDVARAVLFLVVDGPYITGTTIVVDGGLTLSMPGFYASAASGS